MSIKNNIISFWKQVRLKSSDMFSMFKIGIGVKVPTHKLHVKDATDPLKIEGLQNDTTDPDKFLTIDSNNIVKYRTGSEVLSDIGGTPLTTEEVQDIAGALISTGFTKTGISITYDDTNNDMDFVIDDLHNVGVDGSANQILTDDGDGTVTSESELTFGSNVLELGGDDITSIIIRRKTHGDDTGGPLVLRAGNATGTNKGGGDLRFHSGLGTGTGTGGEIRFSVSAAGSSGSTAHSDPATRILTLTSTAATIVGNIAVTGTVDGVDISARDHDAVTLANTNYLSLSGQEITGGTVPVGSGGTGATTFTSGQILRGNGTSALTADSDLSFDSSIFTVQSSTSAKPVIVINNTNADAEAPEVQFIKGTAGSDGDDLGKINFEGFDPDGNQHIFAQALGEIVVAANGSEEGKLTLSVASHDAELQPGLIIASGNAEDEVDVTIGNTATSVTTIAGTLTMGSTAAMTNAGLLSVGNQSNVTGVGTISSGTWQGTAIASAYLDSDTAHLSVTQTFTGEKTFERKVILDGDKSITPSGDGITLHVDAQDITDTNTSASGTASFFNHVVFENPRLMATNSSVTTTEANTVYIKGAPVASTNQTITTANSLKVAGGNVDFAADLSVGANLNVTGNITGKQYQVFPTNFIDDIGTSEVFLPIHGTTFEQSTVYQDDVALVAPCDGRVVSVTLSMMSVTGNSDVNIRVYSRAPDDSGTSLANWTLEETEEVAVDSNDDNHVIHFGFSNAKHFESTEKFAISIQADSDIMGNTYVYATTVIEWDYSTLLGASATYESAP